MLSNVVQDYIKHLKIGKFESFVVDEISHSKLMQEVNPKRDEILTLFGVPVFRSVDLKKRHIIVVQEQTIIKYNKVT